MTFEAVRKIALGMEGVEEATSYSTPAFKVKGTMIARLRDDIGALVVRMRIEDREQLIAEDPQDVLRHRSPSRLSVYPGETGEGASGCDAGFAGRGEDAGCRL